ncbi:hypothetical protein Pyrfu_1283 [Pyrolobus fumarii 1A]|uniref:Uncharacterized protein n=2 Tax=Pyrolobus fumarii TaxID=54252 RepID=G0EGB7_PYRF1|nr:hypothetical protein Pyrfu_1283 [Pyrolobus fumarii 1A]
MFRRLVDVHGVRAESIGRVRDKLETLLCSPLPEPVVIELEPIEALLEAMDKDELLDFSLALLKAQGLYIERPHIQVAIVDSETVYDATIKKHVQQYTLRIYTGDLIVDLHFEYKMGESKYTICYEVWQRNPPPQSPTLLHSTCK